MNQPKSMDNGPGVADSRTSVEPPLITVAIPWIGREKFIAATLEALRHQDYPNLEIIVSDNSLSPQARALLEDLNDGRLKLIDRSAKRLSSADHFSACVRDAAGEYMMILSDDDLIEPGYVSGMYQGFRSNPRTTAVIGEQVMIGEFETPVFGAPAELTARSFDGARFFIDRLLHSRRLPILTYVSVFARRADLLKFPYRNYPDGSNSDNFMMLCLALLGDVTVSSRKMYYRVYESSSGLRATFADLMKSCALYERDVRDLLEAAQPRVDAGRRLALRLLLRVRNCTMMGRRLLTLYRRRMGFWEFAASTGRLVGYLVVGMH